MVRQPLDNIMNQVVLCCPRLRFLRCFLCGVYLIVCEMLNSCGRSPSPAADRLDEIIQDGEQIRSEVAQLQSNHIVSEDEFYDHFKGRCQGWSYNLIGDRSYSLAYRERRGGRKGALVMYRFNYADSPECETPFKTGWYVMGEHEWMRYNTTK